MAPELLLDQTNCSTLPNVLAPAACGTPSCWLCTLLAVAGAAVLLLLSTAAANTTSACSCHHGMQVSLLTAATLIYFSYLTGPPELGIGVGLLGGVGMASVAGIPLPVVAFAALVVLSRVGMWCMEMVNAQLFQAAVPQREMSSASSAEMALCRWAGHA